MSSGDPYRKDLIVETMAGLTAGLCSTVLLHPIEMFKIRLQAAQKPFAAQGPDHVSARHVFVQEGALRALYRGLTPNVVGNSASWALYFLWYDMAKNGLHFLKGPDAALNSYDYMIASATSSLATSSLTNPIWVVKTRMLTSSSSSPSHPGTVAQHIRQIYTSEGPKGFYRGLAPSLFGTLTFSIQFTIYEKLKAWRGAKSSRDLGSWDYVSFSAASKLVAGGLTYPYQVLRTQMQMCGARQESRSVRSLVAYIWRTHGVRGFYRGMVPGVLRVIPSTCITFLVYENARKTIESILEEPRAYTVAKRAV